MTRYETAKPPRFNKELLPGGYEFVIPARKNWFALLFLPIWLTGWTIGGVMAVWAFAESHEPFLALWLLGWAAGWLFAFATIVYMLAGVEVIRYSAGDLSIGVRAMGLSRLKHFRGSEIKRLSANDGSNGLARQFNWQPGGPFMIGRAGAVSFDHGARTFYAGSGLDRAEAEIIATDLRRSLPTAI
jgi:hypothetical protein